jgi:hypothetical protein
LSSRSGLIGYNWDAVDQGVLRQVMFNAPLSGLAQKTISCRSRYAASSVNRFSYLMDGLSCLNSDDVDRMFPPDASLGGEGASCGIDGWILPGIAAVGKRSTGMSPWIEAEAGRHEVRIWVGQVLASLCNV